MIQMRLFKKRDLYILGIFFCILAILIMLITTPIPPVHKINTDFTQSDPTKLASYVSTLVAMDRSYMNHESLSATGDYLKNTLAPYCDSVHEQSFIVENQTYRNIICVFNPSGDNLIVVGAHYDTAGSMPGADDNASGVAGILELARLLSKNKEQDLHSGEKRIELVAYTLEEPPFFSSEDMGSFQHAKMIHEEYSDLKLMISLEMIGYYTDEPDSQSFPLSLLKPFYPSTGNFIALVGRISDPLLIRTIKKHMRAVVDTPIYSISSPAFIPGIDFSDHRSYWEFNYPAVMITDTSFYRNDRYHTEKDTPDTLDYERMADVVNGVYWTVANY